MKNFISSPELKKKVMVVSMAVRDWEESICGV